jgi:hypothetical protein
MESLQFLGHYDLSDKRDQKEIAEAQKFLAHLNGLDKYQPNRVFELKISDSLLDSDAYIKEIDYGKS